MDIRRNYDIRFIDSSEWQDAIAMVYKTFLEFDAPLFTKEGVDHFRSFLCDTSLKRMFDAGTFSVIGAFDGPRIVGVIALRNESHISLLFVDKEYHRQKIGTGLVMCLADYVGNKLHKPSMSVNASPYAYDFYHKLGFFNIDEETHADGITFTPMRLVLGE